MSGPLGEGQAHAMGYVGVKRHVGPVVEDGAAEKDDVRQRRTDAPGSRRKSERPPLAGRPFHCQPINAVQSRTPAVKVKLLKFALSGVGQ